MKNFKNLLCFVLSIMVLVSLVACSTTPQNSSDENNLEESVTANNTSTNVDSNDEEAWKKEAAYGKTLNYFYDGGNCTSAPYFADKLGFFKEAGIDIQGFKSPSYTEALGTNAAQLAVGHISTMLVPSTNGVDLSFVAGAHIGCKTLYVLADSEYNSTADLKGLKVSAPNGIGASDYNILARFFDQDGINPLTEVNLVQVETSACVTAMQNGEIAGALLSDTFAYKLVKDGVLKPIRSLLDEDFVQEACCIVAMNATFVKENPITAKKVTEAMKKAGDWMRENPEEAVRMLLDDGQISGDYDMNVELWKTLQFGLTDEFTKNGLENIVKDYIKLGLITAYEDPNEVMKLVWTPTAPESN
ncbi:ABC transporter substrate-binding protein [Tissierella carlieri]|uniref:ABC transporter substrate-binding protein n=1 Tax=Tissierella carlieri TaxID=689904 RepID=UPI00386325B9